MDEVNEQTAARTGIAANQPANTLLPAQSPLPMPIQPLRSGPAAHDGLTWTRAVLLLSTACTTATFACVLYQVLSIVHLTFLQGVFLVLCTLCFAWIAFGTSSAVIGFFAALFAETGAPAERLDGRFADGRTALLFPIYHEDTARIAATIEALAEELAALGQERNFDFFVLSDSRDSAIRSRELRAVRLLRRQLRGGVHLYYRARSENTGKKAGNIADWVQRFGAAYETFIILDADSAMSGVLVIHLRSLMAENPRTGLMQTVPRLVSGVTLFARLQQFAVGYYGPIVAAGFAAWHHESGNYWGHNAILRTRAFAEAAGLPILSGRPPFGGHIQSHDFVEAAFLRRAGWEVHLVPYLPGSYEGCPPTLIDVAVRDRRWAQGNLQHLRVVGTAGVPWMSRVHLAVGTYAYFASALWAMSLIVGVLLSGQSAYTLPVYFPDQKTLFPIWPVIDSTKALYLFLGTMAAVLLPKALGVGLALIRSEFDVRRIRRLLLGAGIETGFSILIAPILMLTQTQALVEILCGKDSGWSAQRRDGVTFQWREIVRFHRWHMLTGAVLAVVCGFISAHTVAWMSPIIIGLLFAAGITSITSKSAPDWVNRALATSEDMQPPAIITSPSRSYLGWARRLEKKSAAQAPDHNLH